LLIPTIELWLSWRSCVWIYWWLISIAGLLQLAASIFSFDWAAYCTSPLYPNSLPSPENIEEENDDVTSWAYCWPPSPGPYGNLLINWSAIGCLHNGQAGFSFRAASSFIHPSMQSSWKTCWGLQANSIKRHAHIEVCRNSVLQSPHLSCWVNVRGKMLLMPSKNPARFPARTSSLSVYFLA